MSLGGHIHVLNPQLPSKKQDDYNKHTQASMGLRLKWEQAGLIKYFQQVSQILTSLSLGSRSEFTIFSGNFSLEYAVSAWQM